MMKISNQGRRRKRRGKPRRQCSATDLTWLTHRRHDREERAEKSAIDFNNTRRHVEGRLTTAGRKREYTAKCLGFVGAEKYRIWRRGLLLALIAQLVNLHINIIIPINELNLILSFFIQSSLHPLYLFGIFRSCRPLESSSFWEGGEGFFDVTVIHHSVMEASRSLCRLPLVILLSRFIDGLAALEGNRSIADKNLQ